MHDFLVSFFLGIIEGITEFLPVSSTAHLRIAEQLFNLHLDDPFWKMYSIVIQLGAILAVPLYFWERILKFVNTFPRGERGDRTVFTHPLSLTLVAFFITAVPSFLLSKIIGKNLENLTVIAVALLVGGAVMWLVDALCKRPYVMHMEEMSPLTAVWIGAVQILSAVFPGTSRSMCTIAAGQLAGMSREAALEFSFFLSIPTMLVATGYTLLKTALPHHQRAIDTVTTENLVPMKPLGAHEWGVLAIGFVVSFIVALVVIAWFMRWVRHGGFVPFAIYRILLGIALLALLFS
jgi:undecaprenyl-diphosphatase